MNVAIILVVIFIIAVFSNMVANAWSEFIHEILVDDSVKTSKTLLFMYALTITLIILLLLLIFHDEVADITGLVQNGV